MALATQAVDYDDNGTVLQGYVAYDDAATGPRPVVMVGHQWAGHDDFAREQAEALAHLGYVGFAWDIYGKGVQGTSVEENSALMTPFMEDRSKLAGRLNAAVATAKTLPNADASRMAAIGFCFGGLCCMDLARHTTDLAGIVSFHGLMKPSGMTQDTITTRMLLLHGAEDPLAPNEELVAVQQELTDAGADWEVRVYGHAKHAFAVPGAHIADLGIEHQDVAEQRSRKAMLGFLEELFG